ncbi:Ycf53-like protein [Scenedesmus sp. PABB004]|nr:Ycf53-like protein [Scenedesmus sp. PABB004]
MQALQQGRQACRRPAGACAARPPAPAALRARRVSGLARQRPVATASKLEDVPLFADSSSVGAKPASSSSSPAPAKGGAATKLEDVPLNSELGLDYAPLRDYLAAGDVRKADDETRALLIKMAGPGAVQRGWVYFTEVPGIPSADLTTVDALWRAGSGGRFGYSVQREMWVQAGRRWPKFFKAIDWTQGENNVYRKWPAEFAYAYDAPKGHMPLTNALRGTQLFQAIMEHPAFARRGGPGGAGGMSIDERSKSAGANTLRF